MNNMYILAIIGVIGATIIITPIPLTYGQIGPQLEPTPPFEQPTIANSRVMCELVAGGEWIQHAGEEGKCLLP